MFFEILLFAGDPGLLHLESLAVLKLYVSLLQLYLLDHLFKVVVDLTHDFNLTLFDFVLELCALLLQVLGVEGQIAEIFYNHVPILLQDVD